jgi:hypothetical protein
MTGEHDDFRSLGWLRRHIPMALRVLVQADCPTKEVRHCFLLRDRQGGIGQRRMPIDSAIKMFALAIQTERQAYGLDKPVAQRSKTTVTETSLSVTRELTSDIQEKLQKLSPVSRDIMRQLTAKTLRLLQFQTETFEEGDSDSGNIATPRSPSEWFIEDRASGQSLIQELKALSTLPVIPVRADSDKVARAQAATPLMEAGKVFLPEFGPWLTEFIDEMAAFPSGVHDDAVDSSSQLLASRTPVSAPGTAREGAWPDGNDARQRGPMAKGNNGVAHYRGGI